MTATGTFSHHTSIGVLFNCILQHVSNALLRRNVDVLTSIMYITKEQGSTDSKGSMHGGSVFRLLRASHRGRLICWSCDTHQATHSVFNNGTGLITSIGPSLPKTGDRA